MLSYDIDVVGQAYTLKHSNNLRRGISSSSDSDYRPRRDTVLIPIDRRNDISSSDDSTVREPNIEPPNAVNLIPSDMQDIHEHSI